MSPPLGEYGPTAIIGMLAVILNQYVNWHRERRADRQDVRAGRGDELARYQKQMDGVIGALERRVRLAEETERRCAKRCTELERRVREQDHTITRLSRELAHVNGHEEEEGSS